MMAKARAGARKSTTVRARLPPEKAKMFQRMMASTGKTESELVREAIDLLDLRERRLVAARMLADLVPEKIPSKKDYAARLGKW